jgi:molybdate transport system substrate-binding protein
MKCGPGTVAVAVVKQLRQIATLAAASLLVLTGCSTPSNDASSPSATNGAENQKLVVFAAASLNEPFTEIGEQFKADNPGADVEFSFAGSSDLATQLINGAPADVFASADTNNMNKAGEAGLISGDPVNFATNTLTIVTAPGNPKKIASFRDLTQPDLSVVVCAPQVPCGSATEKVEKAAGVQLDPVSEESQVTDVLGKVTTGQADAGLVYVTDAQGAGDQVTAVAFPESADAVNTYPISVLEQSQNSELAKRFVDVVTGEQGQKILTAAGFASP